MTKIQTIFCLLLFIVIFFSLHAMFGQNVKESFYSINKGTGFGYVGKKLDYKPQSSVNSLNGNMGYPGKAYLGIALPPSNYVVRSDDQPLSYGYG
jgi:hypothetical protein